MRSAFSSRALSRCAAIRSVSRTWVLVIVPGEDLLLIPTSPRWGGRPLIPCQPTPDSREIQFFASRRGYVHLNAGSTSARGGNRVKLSLLDAWKLRNSGAIFSWPRSCDLRGRTAGSGAREADFADPESSSPSSRGAARFSADEAVCPHGAHVSVDESLRERLSLRCVPHLRADVTPQAAHRHSFVLIHRHEGRCAHRSALARRLLRGLLGRLFVGLVGCWLLGARRAGSGRGFPEEAERVLHRMRHGRLRLGLRRL